MPLTCPECWQEIASADQPCPHCGAGEPPATESQHAEAHRARREIEASRNDRIALVLGILGLFCCLCSPFALYYGRPGRAGRTLGAIGIILWTFGLLIWRMWSLGLHFR